jgi:hypothetical protein
MLLEIVLHGISFLTLSSFKLKYLNFVISNIRDRFTDTEAQGNQDFGGPTHPHPGYKNYAFYFAIFFNDS